MSNRKVLKARSLPAERDSAVMEGRHAPGARGWGHTRVGRHERARAAACADAANGGGCPRPAPSWVRRGRRGRFRQGAGCGCRARSIAGSACAAIGPAHRPAASQALAHPRHAVSSHRPATLLSSGLPVMPSKMEGSASLPSGRLGPQWPCAAVGPAGSRRRSTSLDPPGHRPGSARWRR